MSEDLEIQSHKGPYRVKFKNSLNNIVEYLLVPDSYFIVDANVARIFKKDLDPILNSGTIIILEATEKNKSIERVIPIMEKMINDSFRRNHMLVAIGGGITQDVSCFIASTLFRGVEWKFVPTTLLAQADSCIGSKSSINLGRTKNIIGTFYPPSEVLITPDFLSTLTLEDTQSGIGEILKVHAIDSVESFDKLSSEYDSLFTDENTLNKYIENSLLIKQRYIEIDEFDKSLRNIFNYGHSFGHAIEAATNFEIPHGIAVSIGMDFANRIAVIRGLITNEHFIRMHEVLLKNYEQFKSVKIPIDLFLAALLKDKKNTTDKLVFILPKGSKCEIQKVELSSDDLIKSQCIDFLSGLNK